MPSGTKAEKAAKRRKVVAGLVAGKPTKRIAKEARCTERHVQRLAAEPETQFLITDVMRPHRAKLAKLVEKSIRAVELALAAKKTDKVDHFTRLRAVERSGDLLELAQGGKPKELPIGEGVLMEWEQFVVMFERRREIIHAKSDSGISVIGGGDGERSAAERSAPGASPPIKNAE